MDDCPMEPWIPKSMFIGGAVNIAYFLSIVVMTICNLLEKKIATKVAMVVYFILLVGTAGWNIAISYFAFKEWAGWDDVEDDPKSGCHKQTYLFVFWWMVIGWIFVPCTIYAMVRAKSHSDDD